MCLYDTIRASVKHEL